EPQWMIGKNMELMLPQLEKYLFPQPNTGSVNIAQTQTEAKNDATPAKKPLL
ncbi:C13 family peptidase, partial [Acinetobacter baumannii]